MSKDSPVGDCSEVAREWLNDLFAPWIKELNLRIDSVRDGRTEMVLPFDDRLCRQGGTICGQALMAAADTSMVMSIGSLFGEFRPTTTVSLNTSFLRPVAQGDVAVVATVLKPGRNLMFGEIELTGSDGKLVAHATTTYAMV